ncbi:hypothetical protein PILCRDRAFT_813697 [Piloderma croceum F 1598]|uniref:N-acetyltransferase domain-containing protein n=1 Tax=Piloderma croceum (strain F 1598) TaxID=765440 RepID=A0A0C3FX05_PILCF|nr:hypothetical protein PILCRDRAFT_813697 [Piloderma croceum F 1598]
MVNRQLSPLQVNPRNGEPFLQLPSPHEHIIITPLRLTDKPAIIDIMNDKRVSQWLEGPPYPYLQEHADLWVDANKEVCDVAIRELEEENRIHPGGPLKVVESCPVRSIREVKADGTDVFLGDIRVDRCANEELDDDNADKENSLVDANMAKQTGDPSIVWTIGDYLAPSHHRQGIMSAAIAALLKDWVIPRCNVHIIRTYAMLGNEGSVGVFRKNGFKLVKTKKVWKELKGKERGLSVLEWRLEDQ